MRNPGGNLLIEDPDPFRGRGEVARREFDTITCGHCNGLVKVLPHKDLHMCKKCTQFVCPGCFGRFVCVPFEKKLEIWEEKIARGIEREITLKTYGM